MRCQLIQTSKIANDNRAEREMLDFLSNLPEGYWVYRELQIVNALADRMKGYEKKQPDFVVVAPTIGLLSIEVKDWNFTRNNYEWLDQYRVVKIKPGGARTTIGNPSAQAEAYKNAFIELLSGFRVFVTSIVAFPRSSRADFRNRLSNIDALSNPQSKFFLDPVKIPFREDLDKYITQPELLLQAIVQKHPRFETPSLKQIERVNELLLPSTFRIGEFTDRQRNKGRVRKITEDQERWIFGLDSRKNYLLDVAGSGKTNVLISRAIHTVKQAGAATPPKVLLTTYNRNLETNIRRLLDHKIASDPERVRLQDAITVQCIPTLIERMVVQYFDIADLSQYRHSSETQNEYEDRLGREVDEILRADADRFRAFDHVFIDEIQDFNDLYLLVAAHLCRSQSFFFVGDIGQKIYDREHHLARLGLITQRLELKKSYQMFRTPRNIAELATRFVLQDPACRQEFREHGYTDGFRYPNVLKNVAEVRGSGHCEEDAVQRAQDFLNGSYAKEDIMIISSSARLPIMERLLQNSRIGYSIGESSQGKGLTLVDFMNVKGLEREIVIVSGIEDLYHRGRPEAVFDDEDTKYRQERLSRRKVYVALTRPLEQLIVYYEDAGNPFVADLVAINREILKRQQGTGYGI